ncbi:hypothetical protein ASPACDRAFT_36764 [Aspergillus aculeatus ATCC 16872]|uniref:Enoyl reductase (ER) domain-containing protein n=1 Tax=Aspergillus aculeatus (strain ATCC 16872 / CBS 172.66 / WB 5094) TaxID=690307 RepID=A0A1L9WGM4_ASPA1|nr:uncharacterized protein ASPACDRAFT_36764 [Aspergillus aculeatus ATCC 16872]OJJ95322.1 hypothetical protein ASPACDRAFT_36764 [Aspergillus aculeatus ATCC 16872]
MAQKTAIQYQLLQKGGSFVQALAPHPTPGPEEVCVRTKAVALNPLDVKNRDHGTLIPTWPTVLGIDAAGIVDAVGASVQGLRPGDEVLVPCTPGGLSGGAFQEVVTVGAALVAKKPAGLTFEEAASLPLCYLTAAAAVSVGLRVPLPHLDPEGTPSSLRSILVLGASSATGAAAVQLLRTALPSATILTTSAASHHARLEALGATRCFERAAASEPAVIRAATVGGGGVDAILDIVEAAASEPEVLTSLNPDGPKVYAHVVTGTAVDVPEGVQSVPVNARQIFEVKGGAVAMPRLGELLAGGKYKIPVRVEIIGKGWEAVARGLDRLGRGVSGTKLVVSL